MSNDPTDTPMPDPEETAHDALMLRLIEAVYLQAVTCAKIAELPPRFIPRTLVCAACHGVSAMIDNYVRRQDDPTFHAAARAGHHARIMEDMAELHAALTEAADTLGALRASFTVPSSNLIS